MCSKYCIQICQEIKNFYRSGLLIYMVSISIFSVILASFIIPSELICQILPLLLVVTLMSINFNINRNDLLDGWEEVQLSALTTMSIVVTRMLSMLFFGIIGLVCAVVTCFVMHNLGENYVFIAFVSIILLMVLASAFCVLINITQRYFRNYFVTIILLPLMIPNIIFSSIAISSLDWKNLYFMFGIDCMLLPIVIISCDYLLNWVYSFEY